MTSARTSLRDRLRRFWREESGVATVEWIALLGAASIGAVAAFYYASTTGLQPSASIIETQLDTAAYASFQSAQ